MAVHAGLAEYSSIFTQLIMNKKQIMKILITYVLVICGLVSTSAQNIPIDFEENGNGADWTWTTFENDTDPPLEIIDNPDASGINTSSTVAKFTALQTGQPFAGCETLIGADIGNFTIDASNSIIRIMVWKTVISDVGIKLVRADGFSLGEIKIPNTVTEEWEQIEFDFSSHIGNNYDQIVIFPDFNDRQSDNVVYFDNVYGEIAMPTSSSEVEAIQVKLSPNPATNSININSSTALSRYEIYSITGQLLHFQENVGDTTINIANLPKGIYVLKAYSGDKIVVEQFVKE
jgi:hypothetical protein